MDVSLVVILTMAIIAGLYMAWAIGANDVANSMGTSVGSGAITVGGAIVIAAVFEFLGAFLAGGEVTSTIRKGIIDAEALEHDPDLLVVGMLSALLAASVWLTVASAFGWPVSTTHSIVGAIIGFAVVTIGFEAVHWWDVAVIAASWVFTPVLAGVMSFCLVLSVQRLIFDKSDPAYFACRYVPVYIFAAVFITSAVTFIKGLKHVGLDLSMPVALIFSVMVAGIIAVAGRVLVYRLGFPSLEFPTGRQSRFDDVERVFGILMIVTASGMAFAHGSNDVANAIGPVAAIIGVVSTGGVAAKSAVPVWVLLLGASGIVVGLATFGYRVMATIGRKITELTPSRGFAAELAAASTVVVASGTGLPVSTTQTLVGAVLGVGLARGVGELEFGVVRTIFVSRVVTLPVGAAIAVIFYYLLAAMFLGGAG
ncbi:MAG: inorganic phosphate transporter [Boseongicola sp. SB0675_bin_26]|nr:inorganic phosphate transporter [Boseongicola sp. SB0675_bin_26]